MISSNITPEEKELTAVGCLGNLPRDAASFDNVLASTRPFSDPTYIFECTMRKYVDRLKMLEPHLFAAREAREALIQATPLCQHRILGDAITRAAINQALSIVTFGQDATLLYEMNQIIALTASLLRSNGKIPVSQVGAKLPNSISVFGQPIWFWSNDRADDPASRLFSRLYEKQEIGRSVLITPTPGERNSVARGIQLLTEVLPELTKSVLHHVSLICLCDPPGNIGVGKLHFTSFTTILAPGTVFISRSLQSSVWHLAEAILHEALHAKLYDFQHTHSLFLTDDPELTKPVICALWNRPIEEGDNCWPLNRSLFAFHVYVHLGVYFRALQSRLRALEASFGPCSYIDLDVCARRALDRAHYLGHTIARCSNRLGAAGQALLIWLTNTLRDIDPSPPVPGAYLHLVLDLYQRETEQIVNNYLENQAFASSIPPRTVARLRCEIAVAQAIFAKLALAVPAPNIELHLQESDHLTVEVFARIRAKIAEELYHISVNQCGCKLKIAEEEITIGQAVQGLVLHPEEYSAKIQASRGTV